MPHRSSTRRKRRHSIRNVCSACRKKKKGGKKKFRDLGYRKCPDRAFWESKFPSLRVLLSYYHGMGHEQVLLEKRNLHGKKRYLLGLVGGSDYYAALDNEKRLERQVRTRSAWKTWHQVLELARKTKNSSPYV